MITPVLRALVAGIRETNLSANLLHPRMFYHRFTNGCNANFMIFDNISQSSTRFRSCYTKNIPEKSFHHEVTESGDELHLAALI